MHKHTHNLQNWFRPVDLKTLFLSFLGAECPFERRSLLEESFRCRFLFIRNDSLRYLDFEILICVFFDSNGDVIEFCLLKAGE